MFNQGLIQLQKKCIIKLDPLVWFYLMVYLISRCWIHKISEETGNTNRWKEQITTEQLPCFPQKLTPHAAECWIAGWGQTENSGQSSELRTMTINSMNRDYCINESHRWKKHFINSYAFPTLRSKIDLSLDLKVFRV